MSNAKLPMWLSVFLCLSCGGGSSAKDDGPARGDLQKGGAQSETSISGKLLVLRDQTSARVTAHLFRGEFSEGAGIIMESPNWGEFLDQKMKPIFLNVGAINDPYKRRPRLISEGQVDANQDRLEFKFKVGETVIVRSMQSAQPIEIQLPPSGVPELTSEGVLIRTVGNPNLPSEKTFASATNSKGLDFDYRWKGEVRADGTFVIPKMDANGKLADNVVVSLGRGRREEKQEADGSRWIYHSEYSAKSFELKMATLRPQP